MENYDTGVEDDEACASHNLVVRMGDQLYPVTVNDYDDSITMVINGEEVELETDWAVGDTMMSATVNGEDISVHVCKGAGVWLGVWLLFHSLYFGFIV